MFLPPRVVRIAVALLLAGAAVARAQTVAVPTFSVGRPTFGDLLQDVDVAAAPDGGFAVVWGDYTYGNRRGDHAAFQRFSALGNSLAGALQLDTSGHVFRPILAHDPRGGWVAAWQWIGGGEYLFFAQTMDQEGRPRGRDFEMTLDLAGNPITSGTVVGLAGGPIFLWAEAGFWARALDATNQRVGGEMRVGEGGYTSDVAPTVDGGFATVWKGGFGEASSMLRVFGPRGQPLGPARVASEDFGSARVAAGPGGGIAVVGTRWNPDFSQVEIWARRFARDGEPLGPSFLVDGGSPLVHAEPDVEYDERDNLLVTWGEYRPDDGALLRPRARAFDVHGDPLGPAVEIADEPAIGVRAARLAGGGIVQVWHRHSRASGNVVRICAPGSFECGDGVAVAGCEECDDGAGNGAAPDACRADCRLPRCGDGVTDAGEACDDGNALACDGCATDCSLEAGRVCGDGIRSAACGEECDDGPANGAVPGACGATCRLPVCGDGVVDPGEGCDDGNSASCDGCSFDCLPEAGLPDLNANGIPDSCDACAALPGCAPQPIAGLTVAQLARFAAGRDEFLEVETTASGLGPVFNGTRCAECHAHPVVGGSSARSVTRIGAPGPGGIGFDPLLAFGGPLLQTSGITAPGCIVAGEVVPSEATFVAERNTPALFGLGLVEAIPDLAIRLRADGSDENGDGISGRLNVVLGRVGRFGWKAQVASLQEFAVDAYRDEMGITTPFAIDEPAPGGAPASCDPAPDPEDDGGDVAAFTDFMTLLAPPPPGGVSREARRGRGMFRRLRCQSCHYDRYKTSKTFPVVALRNRKVPLYSDLLLHDMGPDLADGMPQGGANAREFRTAPLWGVRFSAPYMHDGRAATLAEAILAHDGEARAARDGFAALPDPLRAALIAFLESL